MRQQASVLERAPFVLWLTGLSGTGKSTLAKLTRARLLERGLHAFVLDADDLRTGLNYGLLRSRADQIESTRRMAHVTKIVFDANTVVIAASVSPYRDGRSLARSLLPTGRFIEIFVDAPVTLLQQRDVNGAYSGVKNGSLHGLPGVDAPYERPINAEIEINSSKSTPREATDLIMAYLLRQRDLRAPFVGTRA